MIVDFHTHFFPDKLASAAIESLSLASGTLPYTDGTASGLLRSAEKAGISHCVTLPVATNPDKVSRVNDAAVFMQTDDRLIPFGAMHPDCPYWKEELQRLARHGCKGIKLHPVYQSVDLDDVRYLRILDEAASLGLIVVTHTGDDIGFPGVVHCSPAMALRAVKQVGAVKLVLAHMGGWHVWQEAEELLAQASVFLDTSFCMGHLALRPETPDDTDLGLMTPDQMTAMIRAFGADRILFGTDSPWSEQKQAVEGIRALDLTEEEKERILRKNAASLLNIE